MESKKELPLRLVLPKLYEILSTELENLHIHSYDYQANVIEENKGYEIILRYGDGFQKSESTFFTSEMIENGSKELLDFIKSAAQSCKTVMIADYFKMMKS